ncbi:hypothetical protein DBR40_01610 [Pedobacter sp. KBW01]|uniref:DUF6443 domain-containing protein n=1 Tax=Pedobacter sp. KBW01 TaxID=2153364 RepID=UPI000F5A66C2|nr:DUF6443 domain-containing protein [Pedobacter sp. KBW01]RQO79683.1 hypothetical protein DBR40_01610 [Pedobacter sp. KBW01]
MKIQYKFSALILVFGLYANAVFGQNRSYVQEDVVKVPGITTDVQVFALPLADRTTSRTYFDGMGRPIQSVAVGASPSGKDIVQPVAYDNLGRQVVGYLPYASSNANGAFRTNAISEQSSFYATSGQKTAIDANPYSQQLFDNSPMQRILQAGSVGSGFQIGEHQNGFTYRTNLSSETVRRWNADGSANGSFDAGTLSVNGGTDGENSQTVSYTDNNGRTILKKQLLNQGGTTWVETYYVYDDLGQLVFIVPPKAAALMDSYGNYSLQQPEVQKLLFIYLYDERGRQVERTVPGGGTTYLVYDPFDRVVLAQDANLRSQQKWNYIKYDSRNTPIIQGIYYNGSYISRASMQGYVNGLSYSNAYEERNGNGSSGYYTNNCFPASDTEPLAYSYYDDYDLDGNGSADYAYQGQGMAGEAGQGSYTNGLPTMMRKRTVGSGLSNIWLTSVMFYDAKGRLIQSQGNNQLNTAVNSLSTTVADFTGKALRSRVVQVATVTTVVQTEYTYDHRDRLKTVDESYNGGTPIRTGAYEYNELGQLVDRKLHSTNGGASYLQSVDYRYNIRGQITSINNSGLSVDDKNDDNNDVFGMELLYSQSDSGIGNNAYFNGALSAVKWKVNAPGVVTGNERSYKFTYDKLLRLSAAVYSERSGGGGWNNSGAFDEKNISYDLNGNILTLQRNAVLSGSIAAVDDLTYSYDGNRLSNVSDGNGGSYGLFGFKNLTGSGAGYDYDASGNMTSDAKKGINLDYNLLNRTDKVTVTTAGGRYITYTYDAGGGLIRKQAFDNSSLVKTTDYIGGFVYEDNALAYFGMAEGRVRNNSGTLKPEYMIKDQQGNVRVSFEEQGGVAVVRQENSYYPFGLTMPGSVTPTAANKKLYNGGSEWQNDFGDLPDLQQTFYRMYDAALGRFIATDPLAEASESMTVYQYALNSPLIFNDPLGDKAAGPVTGQYADFWNTALAYTKSYGASWNGSSGFSAFGSNLEGFTSGAETMSNNGTWGKNGWAQDYASASQAFYEGTGIQALKSDKDGYLTYGAFYRDANGNSIQKNGVSGEYRTFYAGNSKQTSTNNTSWIDFGSLISKASGKIGEWGDKISVYQSFLAVNGAAAERIVIGRAATSAARAYVAAFSRSFQNVSKVNNILGAAGKVLGITSVVTSVVELMSEDFSYTNLAKVGINVASLFIKSNPIGLGVSLTLGVLNATGVTEKALNYVFNEKTN